MLRGNIPATVDAKGRLKLPTDFKNYLYQTYGTEFYVTSPNGESVLIYPAQVWEEMEKKLKEQPSMTAAVKKYIKYTSYFGHMGQGDSQGRILIPGVLRESAAMQGVVAVLGFLDHLEVWNQQKFVEYLKKDPFTEADENALRDLKI